MLVRKGCAFVIRVKLQETPTRQQRLQSPKCRNYRTVLTTVDFDCNRALRADATLLFVFFSVCQCKMLLELLQITQNRVTLSCGRSRLVEMWQKARRSWEIRVPFQTNPRLQYPYSLTLSFVLGL